MLPLGELHAKHAVQCGIWVPTQHLLWDQRKPWETLIGLAGRRTFRMQTGLALNLRALTLVSICDFFSFFLFFY
jgi:hypothetical protein